MSTCLSYLITLDRLRVVHETWFGHHVTGDHRKFALFNVLLLAMPNSGTCEARRTLAPQLKHQCKIPELLLCDKVSICVHRTVRIYFKCVKQHRVSAFRLMTLSNELEI